jgi:hypothetical protein
MNVVKIFILLAGVFLAGCDGGHSSAPAGTSPTQSNASGNPLTAPVDYLGAASRAQKLANKTTAEASLGQAIKMFEGQEGRLPRSLNELVPKYVPTIPAPPAGMKYVYNPADGSLKVTTQ